MKILKKFSTQFYQFIAIIIITLYFMIYSINEQLADMSMSQTISIEEDKEIKQANLDSGYLITYVK